MLDFHTHSTASDGSLTPTELFHAAGQAGLTAIALTDHDTISGLPELRRAVFNLYCIDGYTHKQIAQMLGITEKGSAGALAKARKQLKEKIRTYLKKQ